LRLCLQLRLVFAAHRALLASGEVSESSRGLERLVVERFVVERFVVERCVLGNIVVLSPDLGSTEGTGLVLVMEGCHVGLTESPLN